MPSIIDPMATSSPPLTTPSKRPSILRASTATSPKKRAITDTAGEDSSPVDSTLDSKRRKVAFVPQPSVRVVDERNEKSVTLVREEVRFALNEHNAGKPCEQYVELVAIIEASPADEDAPSDSLLSKYLLALANNAGALQQECSDLVHAVLRLKWLDRDPQLVRRYSKFLLHLATSNSGYLHSILKMLVENFAHLTTSAATESTLIDSYRMKFYDQLHASIADIVYAVPSSISQLSSVISSCFPFITDNRQAHIEYVSNLLRFGTDYPELKAYILDLIMDRVAQIDVRVQMEIEGLDEDMEALLDDDEFRLDSQSDDDDDDGASDAGSDDSDTADRQDLGIVYLRGSIFKLDGILDLVFSYCSPAFKEKASVDEKTIFSILLAQFRNNLLKQYQSRHAQFVIFHFAQQSPELATKFIDTCLSIMSDRARTDTYDKVSAAAYLASFVCRGAHLGSDEISYAIESLATFINDQRKASEPACRGPDLRLYSPYYAAVQALMYMFCFRWRNLLIGAEDDEEIDDEDVLDGLEGQDLAWPLYLKETFSLNFHSALNPLKVCNPSIVDQFAQMAIQLNFMFIHGKLESNKRVRLGHRAATKANQSRQTASSQLHAQSHHQLDAYFPFDPYQLPVSKRWVASDYNEWQAPPVRMAGPQGSDSSDAEILEALEPSEALDNTWSDNDD